ncbi:hypothetical protein [Bacillus sp. Marseille-P3661]|nr:hypothetical protein [Bacillus sp. Marseille-P3661]
MPNQEPVEYSGRVLDQRNDLTGPDNPGELSKLDRPKHVPVQKPNKQNVK